MKTKSAGFEVFMSMKMQVMVLWVVPPRSVLIGYDFTLKVEAAKSS
jgi:hypothetical protein